MIRYNLRCADGHTFESWFADSASYDRQEKRGLIACPMCASTSIEKAIMAPRVASSKKRAAARAAAPKPPAPAETSEPLMSVQDKDIRAKLKELRDYVTTHAENVGRQFPEQARKMHEGEIAHKPIYGESTPQETRALLEEGVEIMPLPILPDDRN